MDCQDKDGGMGKKRVILPSTILVAVVGATVVAGGDKVAVASTGVSCVEGAVVFRGWRRWLVVPGCRRRAKAVALIRSYADAAAVASENPHK